MAKVFDDLEFGWRGKKYKIASDNVMAAIGAVEEHLTLKELMGDLRERKTIRLTALSQAYSKLLSFAGCDVSPEEIYKGMFVDPTGNEQKTAALAVQALVLMMVPAGAIQEIADKVKDGTLDPKANRRTRRAAVRLSKKLIKQP